MFSRWLVYRKLNCYQCKPPNDNVWAKAVGSHVCRHEEAQRSRQLGRVRPWQGSREAAACPVQERRRAAAHVSLPGDSARLDGLGLRGAVLIISEVTRSKSTSVAALATEERCRREASGRCQRCERCSGSKPEEGSMWQGSMRNNSAHVVPFLCNSSPADCIASSITCGSSTRQHRGAFYW